jgi:hypothetical protein
MGDLMQEGVSGVYCQIREILTQARLRALQAVNSGMVA